VASDDWPADDKMGCAEGNWYQLKSMVPYIPICTKILQHSPIFFNVHFSAFLVRIDLHSKISDFWIKNSISNNNWGGVWGGGRAVY